MIEDNNLEELTHRNLRTRSQWVQYFKERIVQLNPAWTNLSDNDIGMLMVNLVSSLGDQVNYRMDKSFLEFYLDSVVERANAQSLLRLIGYSMSTYQSGRVVARVGYPDSGVQVYDLVIPRYSRFSTRDRRITYHSLEEITLPANTSAIEFEVYEGTFTSEIHSSLEVDKYGRIYLYDETAAVSQNTLTVIYNKIEELTTTDDIYSTTGVRECQLMVDNYGKNYVQLDTNWRSYINQIESTEIKMEYLITAQDGGHIGQGSITTLQLYPDYVTHSSPLDVTNLTSTVGYAPPESIEDARLNAPRYARAMATYVTISDYEDGIYATDPDILDVKVYDKNTPGLGITEAYNLKCYIMMKPGAPLTTELKSKISERLDMNRLATIKYELLTPIKNSHAINMKAYFSTYPASDVEIKSEMSRVVNEYLSKMTIGTNFSPSRLLAYVHSNYKFKDTLTYVSLQSMSQVLVGPGQIFEMKELVLVTELD